MQFDDRLATVLRMRAGGDAVSRTQFRQLLDLLGTSTRAGDSVLRGEAYARLGELMEELPQEDQARILREPGLRLRNRGLAEFLANGPAKVAASAMATARLAEEDWLDVIPQLPVTARGFLRHRRDLSQPVQDLLARLGVGDLVLTDADPDRPRETPEAPMAAPSGSDGIGALLRRIEEFREQRGSQPVSPRLPLDDTDLQESPAGFEFSTDAQGVVVWADEAVAPLLVGLRLTAARPSGLVHLSEAATRAMAAHQPLRSQHVMLDLATQVAGEWWLDAAPIFNPDSGVFTGYRGCLRRPPDLEVEKADSESDAMRQVLHELRTPVNAIQGFAEIIQQQLFGNAPHEYRAHAAAIAVDAAKLLAGFDEVDRLVKMEGGAMEPDEGTTDFHAAIADTVQRLENVLRTRNAGFTLDGSGGPFMVAMTREDAMTLCWRLLATAAGALGPGEEIAIALTGDGRSVHLEMDVPRAIAEGQAGDSGEPRRRAVSAGMFGPAFSFRLARAEAKIAGGDLRIRDRRVTMTIPALTAGAGDHSAETGRAGV